MTMRFEGKREHKCDTEEKSKKEGKSIYIKPFWQKENADREAAYLYNQGGDFPPS